MNNIEYILLQNAIKQNHFRKTYFEKTVAVILISMGIIISILVIISMLSFYLKGNEEPLLRHEVRLSLAVTGFSAIITGTVLKLIGNLGRIGGIEDQLYELDKAKEWCDKFPDQADKLDFLAFEDKAIYNEFFEKE